MSIPAPAAPRWRTLLTEALVGVGAAGASLAYASTVHVSSPMNRVNQISLVASLHLPFMVLAAVAVVIVLVGLRSSRDTTRAVGVACALLAGAWTGFIAGGVMLALDETPVWLGSTTGDSGTIARWAQTFLDGGGLPKGYPPGVVVLVAAVARVLDVPALEAMKPAMLGLVSLVGPAGYLAWRTFLGPVAAFTLGVLVAMPLMDPYKPLTNLVLVVVVVGLVLLAHVLRDSATWTLRALVVRSVLLGVAMAVAFLSYSGWFLWLFPSAVAIVALCLPWSTSGPQRAFAWARAGIALGVCAVSFLALTGVQLFAFLGAGLPKDDYLYFDTTTDPGYFSMWRGDLPGDVGLWPAPGEMGGLDLFTVLLACALGAGACVLVRLFQQGAWSHLHTLTLVVSLAGVASAWAWRQFLASRMFEDENVALWPRTSVVLLYLTLVTAVVVVGYVIGGFAAHREHLGPALSMGAVVAGACALAMSASSIAMDFMPNDSVEPRQKGLLAWISHTQVLPDGTCPVRSTPKTCQDY